MDSPRKLMFQWNYWGFKKKFPDYVNNLFVIKSFDNEKDFFSLYYDIMNSKKQIQDGDVFSVFKNGIKPLVDDPQNALGGEWRISYPRDAKGRLADLKKDWLKILLLMVSGWFGEEETGICGADVDLRGDYYNVDVLSVWNNDWRNNRQIENIRAIIMQHLTLSSSVSVTYHTHH